MKKNRKLVLVPVDTSRDVFTVKEVRNSVSYLPGEKITKKMVENIIIERWGEVVIIAK